VGLEAILDNLYRRLEVKTRRAEEAYVRRKTVKATDNCQHAGRRLEKGIRACKELAVGLTEEEAHCCWDEKARSCPIFELRKQPGKHRKDFREMPEEEFAVRYPTAGELARVIQLVEEELDDESVPESPGRSRDEAAPEEASAAEPPGDVQREPPPGPSDEATEPNSPQKNGDSDSRRQGSTPKRKPRVSVASGTRR